MNGASESKETLGRIEHGMRVSVGLESSYRQKLSAIVEVIEKLLRVTQLEVLEPEVVLQALNDYKE